MPTDRSVIDALTTAVDKDPQNSTLRLHLASVLAENSMFEEALRHAQIVMTHEPTNPTALRQAADAAEKLGDLSKASSYRKLLAAVDTPPEPQGRATFGKDEWADVLEESTDTSRVPQGDASDDFRGSSDGMVVDAEYSDLRLADVAGMEK